MARISERLEWLLSELDIWILCVRDINDNNGDNNKDIKFKDFNFWEALELLSDIEKQLEIIHKE